MLIGDIARIYNLDKNKRNMKNSLEEVKQSFADLRQTNFQIKKDKKLVLLYDLLNIKKEGGAQNDTRKQYDRWFSWVGRSL